MTKAKSQFAWDPRVIRALGARQIYKLAPRELCCRYIRFCFESLPQALEKESLSNSQGKKSLIEKKSVQLVLRGTDMHSCDILIKY